MKRGSGIVRKAAATLGIAAVFGVGTFWLYLLGNFGVFPLYVTKVIPVLGVSAGFALILVTVAGFGARTNHRIGVAFLAVAVLAACYVGKGAYESSLPTVDDRSLLVMEYRPFQKEGSPLAVLEETADFRLENDLRLKLDGATALYPVYAAFVQATYPEKEYSPFHSAVECSGTARAYQRLIEGEVDMIFAAAPSQAQLEAAEQARKEFTLTPIGREAFVFFLNRKNPVESLTVEQIRRIYTGEITNWKQLGGAWQKIRPFQRAEDSGSQTMLQKLMAGLKLMEPETEERIAGMGGIIREVASYRNHSNAIGFSFRYYATEMVESGDIRLLALNGVEPNRESIRDGSYPLTSEFYAITAAPKGEERNEIMSAFLDWVLSDQGQSLIEKTGYVSLKGGEA